MQIIVAGEESGITRDAFAALGHNAWSCDLKPSRSPNGQHYQGSWHDICWESFDVGIMHPECTHLAVSGAKYFAEKRADGRQAGAKVHKCPPGKLRAQIRSESFPEIAAAMARQWGDITASQCATSAATPDRLPTAAHEAAG